MRKTDSTKNDDLIAQQLELKIIGLQQRMATSPYKDSVEFSIGRRRVLSSTREMSITNCLILDLNSPFSEWVEMNIKQNPELKNVFLLDLTAATHPTKERYFIAIDNVDRAGDLLAKFDFTEMIRKEVQQWIHALLITPGSYTSPLIKNMLQALFHTLPTMISKTIQPYELKCKLKETWSITRSYIRQLTADATSSLVALTHHEKYRVTDELQRAFAHLISSWQKLADYVSGEPKTLPTAEKLLETLSVILSKLAGSLPGAPNSDAIQLTYYKSEDNPTIRLSINKAEASNVLWKFLTKFPTTLGLKPSQPIKVIVDGDNLYFDISSRCIAELANLTEIESTEGLSQLLKSELDYQLQQQLGVEQTPPEHAVWTDKLINIITPTQALAERMMRQSMGSSSALLTTGLYSYSSDEGENTDDTAAAAAASF